MTRKPRAWGDRAAVIRVKIVGVAHGTFMVLQHFCLGGVIGVPHIGHHSCPIHCLMTASPWTAHNRSYAAPCERCLRRARHIYIFLNSVKSLNRDNNYMKLATITSSTSMLVGPFNRPLLHLKTRASGACQRRVATQLHQLVACMKRTAN